MNNEENYIPSVQDVNPEPEQTGYHITDEPVSASTDTAQQQWDYYNMVNAVEPEHKKRTGTNQTPAKKLERKKRKARKVQRASRKTNRK